MPIERMNRLDTYTFSEMELPTQPKDHYRVVLYYNRLETRHRGVLSHMHLPIEIDLFGSDCNGTYIIGGKKYAINPKDIFIIRSNEQHSIIDMEGREQCVCTGIQFTPDFLWSPHSDIGNMFNLYQLFIGSSTDFIHKVTEDDTLVGSVRREIEDIVAEFQTKQDGYDQVVKLRLMTLLLLLGRIHEKEGYLPEDVNFQREKRVMVVNVLRYIDEHFTEAITLEEICKAANTSPSCLSEVFKALNGYTIWDYVVSRRIEASKVMLLSTNEKVLTISITNGFNSLTNFNRTFKRLVGMTPREYRKFGPQMGSGSLNFF
jgi:AraC-like DNA-binding protein